MGVWNFAPAPLAAGVTALVFYWQGYSRLRARRRDLARPGNALLFTLGVLTAVVALISPIDNIGEKKLLSVHMPQHLLLADVAPLLTVLGLRGPMSVFVLPARPLRRLAQTSA